MRGLLQAASGILHHLSMVSASKQLVHGCFRARSGSNTYWDQLHRLASFTSWPHQGKLSASSFSSAGFFYTGSQDEVECFSCGLTLAGWKAGMHPLTAHRDLCGGRCNFVSSPVASGDVPLGTIVQPPSDGQGLKPVLCKPAAASVASVGSSAAADNGSASGDAERQLVDSMASCYTSMPLPPSITLLSLVKDPRPAVPACSNVDSNGQLLVPQEEAVKYELYRIQTYRNVWESNVLTPRELAASGFHYAGPGDRVQCAFCQGLLRNWEHGDRAAEQHAQHFTYCRFVQGHEVGNVPLPFSVLEPKFSDLIEVTDERLGISRPVPKHPDMAVESRRMATFITWSSNNQLRPEALAKAGFFFLGTEDAVKCFYCNGTVKDWLRGSDPWVEHARRFSSCLFVEQVKGRDFVLQHTVDGSPSGLASQNESFPVDPREIRARMDSPKVRILLQMDYPMDLLREVVQKRLATVGYDYETSEELLADVFAFHDEKQRVVAPSGTSGQPRTVGRPVIVAASRAGAAVTTRSSGMPGQTPAVAASVSLNEERQTPDVQPQPSLTPRLDPSTAPPTALHPEEENRQLKTQLTCKICMDSLVGIVFLPCGHFVCCPTCAPALTTCPICRVSIRGTVRTYL